MINCKWNSEISWRLRMPTRCRSPTSRSRSASRYRKDAWLYSSYSRSLNSLYVFCSSVNSRSASQESAMFDLTYEVAYSFFSLSSLTTQRAKRVSSCLKYRPSSLGSFWSKRGALRSPRMGITCTAAIGVEDDVFCG